MAEINTQGKNTVMVPTDSLAGAGVTPYRLKVELKTSRAFNGEGVIRCNHAEKIQLFDAAQGGNTLYDATDKDDADIYKVTKSDWNSAGLTVYIQAKAASEKSSDIELEFKANSETAKTQLTFIQAKLDIWDEQDTQIADSDKSATGRIVEVQDERFGRQRAKVCIRQVIPTDFSGQVTLDLYDDKNNKVTTEPKVKLFTRQTAFRGQGAETLAMMLDCKDADVNKDHIFWLEGASVSTTERDARLALTIGDQFADIIALTVTNLTVKVARHDGAPLSQEVQFALSGAATKTVNTVQGIARFFLAPDTYNLAMTPKKDEAGWVKTPDSMTGLSVKKETSTIAEWNLSPYKKAQLIGFNIKPDTQDISGSRYYLGDADAKLDIKKRCDILKESIEAAEKNTNIKKTPDVLKIFMASEFFFRGAQGGYPIETIPEIMTEMGKTVHNDTYKDWLFIWGTAIGYQKHSEGGKPIRHTAIVHAAYMTHTEDIIKVESDDTSVALTIKSELGARIDTNWSIKENIVRPVTKNASQTQPGEYQFTIDKAVIPQNKSTIQLLEPQSMVMADQTNTTVKVKSGLCGNIKTSTYWKIRQPGKEATITKCDPDGDGTYKLTLDKNISLQRAPCELIEPIAVVTDTSKLLTNKVKVEGKIAAQILDDYHWQLIQDKQQKTITQCQYVSGTTYELTLDDATGIQVGPVEFIEPVATEIFNMALVQKGGTATTEQSCSLKQVIVYKEYVSHIDFIRDTSLQWGKPTERKIVIHGETRMALPTSGSVDTLGASPNKPVKGGISEINRSGLGGGGVFTIDGITFGLEVCLDHAYNRLWEFYDKAANSGDPKVQIHLIPSWGMSIHGGVVSCIADGLVFNVDGPSGSDAEINDDKGAGDYFCVEHEHYTDTSSGNCNAYLFDCPSCGKEYAYPKIPAPVCPSCSTHPALEKSYYCTACSSWENNSTCPTCSALLTHESAGCTLPLQHQGTKIPKKAGSVSVGLNAKVSDWKKYASDNDNLTIYEVKDIPGAQLVP
ncbi:hypothetical protein [Vibrio mangrovi]|uniref:Uncharacterized protein n=1 Tax=Vibrio mangrovi TaxID=474394 RepID=A0A1Y6ISF8_9VIBR|nr:hypothetical protein [Vibrio mangrovi]MDW6003241.1 hypothetical protein [Vibrio mangrovi]SMR99971.1 hypothetical protein VIM7927_01209 [Vibrio mangrovi]